MTTAMYVLLLVAVVLANSPFISQKWFGVVPLSRKHFGHHLLELAVSFALTGVLAYVFEAQAGPVHQKDWEFFVVTLALFVVFGFPGFVWRYFWHSRNHA